MLDTEFKFGEVNALANQINQDCNRVHFKRIFENSNGGVSMLAFKQGQQLDTHIAPAEVMIYVIEGEIEFTMFSTPHTIHQGEFLLIGAGVEHSVTALADSKVVLFKVKP